ncbi:YbhB/YbcL family Raf kinase inhibitor-like protein [Corynebacterium sp. sy039]|uniref:YbhB/YbcL family Raf kinase inhibitor-like protein n=1 Tax=Corynebacterium sp. sy039 TaxID=2599641 RepID=UPI0011B5F315|nr:YbhB/YbcL family Raf kinase inhibitor-like protein [Corynebacterium sp. sy039]QDZ42619.1 YbhB/YbcL family Raf kinase inhibitor-like protein [Corynebacterium sp. sy039]
MSNYADDSRFPGPDPYAPLKKLPSFELHSDDFSHGDKLNDIHAAPQHISPHLAWSQLPEGTQSLAITCFDPDAPTAAGYWHWAVFNIPVSVQEVSQGGSVDLAQLPGVTELENDAGTIGYYGPQPPAGHGPHRYLFAVHAVDVSELDITPESTPTVLGFNLYFHSIARSIIWGWYENT